MKESTEELVRVAKAKKMTPCEREDQRRNFVFGNCRIDNDAVTMDLVDREADRI